MKKLSAILLLWAGAASAAGPNILINTQHAGGNAVAAVNAALGAGVVNTAGGIYVDGTSAVDGSPFDPTIIADSQNVGLTFYSVPALTPGNHAPYLVTSSSFSWAQINNADTIHYVDFLARGAMDVRTYGPVSPVATGTAPQAIGATIGMTGTGYASGWGAEFQIAVNYTLNSVNIAGSTLSGGTAAFAGLLASLKYAHPAINWFDIKAALRQTAANWATGWSSATYGYGTINPFGAGSADALLTAGSTIYLQPPNIQVQTDTWYTVITLYPFRQSRRAHEEVWSVPAAYSWPVKNEYTATDIAAAGGTLIYTSSGTDVTPTVVWGPVAGTYTIIAFTVDGAGGYSRVEPFSAQSITLSPPSACTQ